MNFKQIFLTSLIGFISGLIGSWVYDRSKNSQPTIPSPQATSYTTNFTEPKHENRHATNRVEIDFIEASKSSSSCVVYVRTISEREIPRFSWFDMFFGGRMNETVIGSGSGVILTSDGYIVTNHHVISGAERIEIIHQKRTYEAKVVGTDPSTDLALLKIEAQNLPSIRVGSSRDVQIGEWVLAVGNPFNLATTVTAGIVSAKGRNINILKDVFPIESFIQTDAAINPGNSGGALVNQKGELIGINTAILSKTGSYAGYGFAVPVDIVMKVVNDIKKYGEVQKAFFGAEVTEMDENLSKKLNTDDLNGVAILQIAPDGAADKAKLEEGDIILQIDDVKIDTKTTFDEQIAYHSPGDKIKITYRRNGNIKTTELVLTNIEGTTGTLKREIYIAKQLGNAHLEIVPKIERSRYNITSGIRIRKVGNGLLAQLGLQEGTIIAKVNNYAVEKPEELESILARLRGRIILEIIHKDGNRQFLTYLF
ncbi:MAG: trypsin-like peptidase domain-containing protein [Cytophagales bacterium]|nr:trypsin-like peptidase domain-containing protein [Cytophagales bacterium]MDW8384107.1 trypsin-like peptidase domain-containing protein [Flammeovirgaceae bacterium]